MSSQYQYCSLSVKGKLAWVSLLTSGSLAPLTPSRGGQGRGEWIMEFQRTWFNTTAWIIDGCFVCVCHVMCDVWWVVWCVMCRVKCWCDIYYRLLSSVCVLFAYSITGEWMGWYKDITITRYWLYFDEQERRGDERAVRDTRDNAVMTAAAAGIIFPIMSSSLPIATFQFKMWYNGK